jgi:hypothetical protein
LLGRPGPPGLRQAGCMRVQPLYGLRLRYPKPGGTSPAWEPLVRCAVLAKETKVATRSPLPARRLKAESGSSVAGALRATVALVAVGLLVAGCAAVKPIEAPPPAAEADPGCDDAPPNPLHLTTLAAKPPQFRGDPEIDAILTQPTQDMWLADLNRHMYQTLHALDVELQREQALAACRQPALQLQTNSGAGASGAGAAAGGGGAQAVASSAAGGGSSGGAGGIGGASGVAGGAGGAAAATAGASASAGSTGAGAVAVSAGSNGAPAAVTIGNSGSASAGASLGGTARQATLRKTSLSSAGGGGNGATAAKTVAGSGNDIVARRLRKAAEQETNPTLRAKLWKEYTDYQKGTSGK